MSQDLSTLRNFFAFGRWANRTILESVAALTPEEYARPIGGSFGSVQGTILHLYGADWVWLERLHGRSPREMPSGADLAALETLAREWREVEAGQDVYIATLTPERLAEPLSYVAFSGDRFTRRLGDVLQARRRASIGRPDRVETAARFSKGRDSTWKAAPHRIHRFGQARPSITSARIRTSDTELSHSASSRSASLSVAP